MNIPGPAVDPVMAQLAELELYKFIVQCEMVKTDQRHSLGATSLLPPQISEYVFVT
jgi:hypothetical protein